MIITQKKPMEELMAMVGDAKTVAIVGCNSCATACHTCTPSPQDIQITQSGFAATRGFILPLTPRFMQQ